MFQIHCRKIDPEKFEVKSPVLTLQVTDHTPSLKKYSSQPYKCEEDTLISIIIHP